MAALANFAKYVRPEVPMCPEIQILAAILRAGIEFCKRTKIMQEVVMLNTVVDTPSYDLTDLMLDDTEPDDVLSVRRDGRELDPTSQYDALRSEEDTETGIPYYYFLSGRNLHLVLTPNEVEPLEVTIKVRPAETATTLPDDLYRRYNPDIAAGAKSFLMMQANQPWTNLQQAAIYKNMFDTAIVKENLRYAKGGGAKPLRVRQHSF
jgi:hypothetical protein